MFRIAAATGWQGFDCATVLSITRGEPGQSHSDSSGALRDLIEKSGDAADTPIR